MLRETLRSFGVTNDELMSQGNTGQEGFDICNTTTKVRLFRGPVGGALGGKVAKGFLALHLSASAPPTELKIRSEQAMLRLMSQEVIIRHVKETLSG